MYVYCCFFQFETLHETKDLGLHVYVLQAGSKDEQTPHKEDEAYYVLSGSGSIEVDGVTKAFKPGSLIFVGKDAKHRFHSYKDDVRLLVVFAPKFSGD
jgi:mannose-6-phosphate isomerase-like protein (cupin superfamily)